MTHPAYRPANNPANTDTFNRRAPRARELDKDGVSNADADSDYYKNLDKFSGNRCSDQTLPPTRRNGPSK